MTVGQPAATSPFGALLRRWRGHRGLSQLELAASVSSTSRHVSFLETGRSRPSQQMVLRLSDVLGIPLREQNRLLSAAGLPAVYPEAALEDEDLAPFRGAINQLLTAHMPYPAVVVDEYWKVLLANPACAVLFGDGLIGSSLVHRYFDNPAAAQAIINWPHVAWAGVDRLRQQVAQRPFDDTLRELAALAERATTGLARPSPSAEGLVVCPWFRIGGQVIRTIGMAARFDSTVAVTLEELRVELIYPLDSVAERFFRDAVNPESAAVSPATTGPGTQR